MTDRAILDQQGRDYLLAVNAPFGSGRTCIHNGRIRYKKRADAMAEVDKKWPTTAVFLVDEQTGDRWYRPANSREWREGEGEDV